MSNLREDKKMIQFIIENEQDKLEFTDELSHMGHPSKVWLTHEAAPFTNK